MSEEKKHDDRPEITDEQLNDVSGGADSKEWHDTKPMGWDNTKHVKWTGGGLSSSEPEEEPPTDLTR